MRFLLLQKKKRREVFHHPRFPLRTSRWRIASKYRAAWRHDEFRRNFSRYTLQPRERWEFAMPWVYVDYTLPPAWSHRGRVINHKFVPRPHSGVPPNKKHVGQEATSLPGSPRSASCFEGVMWLVLNRGTFAFLSESTSDIRALRRQGQNGYSPYRAHRR